MDYKRLFLICALVIALDQLSKRLIILFIESGSIINIISSLLRFTHTTNTGAGFSLLTGMNLLLIWLGIAIIGGLLYYSTRAPEKCLLPIALIIGGAVGNLIDRIAYGNVIDFIDLGFWPVFNIADSSITIGSILLVLILIREK